MPLHEHLEQQTAGLHTVLAVPAFLPREDGADLSELGIGSPFSSARGTHCSLVAPPCSGGGARTTIGS